MTKLYNPHTTTGKAINRGKHAPHAAMLPTPLDFTNDTTINASINALRNVKNVAGISDIQSVYIDNADNASTIAITFDSGQRIVCPSFAEAIFPVLTSGDVLNFTAVSAGGILVNCWFLNTKEYAQIWTAKIPIAGVINVSGSTVFSSLTAGQFTDRSVTGTGASQAIMAANGARLGWAIRNPATATSQNIAAPEPYFLALDGAAAVLNGLGMWELLPGESVSSAQLGIDSTQAINGICTTAGHRLTAKEF